MPMLPRFGKSRFEIAFVYPKFDGTYKEREARNEIVPRDRWIDSITSQAAFRALRPDGEAFFNDNDMELYARCVKTLLAPCLNWEAVLRSVLVLVTWFH